MRLLALWVLTMMWPLQAAEDTARRFDLGDPPLIARWPTQEERRPFARAWMRPTPCTALVVAADSAQIAAYRALLEARAGGDGPPRLRLVAASEATRADVEGPLLLIGPPCPLTRLYLARTPFPSATVTGPEEIIRASGVNPWDPASPMTVIIGPDHGTIRRFLSGSGWSRRMDFEVLRDGMRVRYGRYSALGAGAWRVDPGAEVDLRARISRVVEQTVRSIYVEGEFSRDQARAAAARAAADLQLFIARLGGTMPSDGLDLVLYPDLQTKGMRTDDPRASHLEVVEGRPARVHAIVKPGTASWDRIGLARAAVRATLGDIGPKAASDGIAVWLADGMLGRSLDWWEARLSRAGLGLAAQEFTDDRQYSRRTYLVAMPSAALTVRRLAASRDAARLEALLRDPAMLASAVGASAVARSPRGGRPAAARTAALPFQKGISLAHEGYAVSDGYGSTASFASLAAVASMGADAVALSPYGFMRDPAAPAISFPRSESQNPGSENDEAVLATLAEAHRLGMKVMVKPQIWLPHGHWTGEISMSTEESWRGFFGEYGEFLAHYALLSAAGGADLLVVGVELSATTSRQAEWRALIERARSLYDGPLTYAANWGDEFESLGFWDALDYAGLDCYYPLSDEPGATDARLSQGAREVAARVAEVARRARRAVLLTEAGFPAMATAWTSPHDDRKGRGPDDEAQARGYRALLSAFWDRPWLAGVYWWKWPTTSAGQRDEPAFSPRGRPAEQVLRQWYARPRPADWTGLKSFWSSPSSGQP